MSQLIPGDASLVFTRFLILFVWGVTPFCWLSLLLRLLCWYLARFHSAYLDESPLFQTSILRPIFKYLRTSHSSLLSTCFFAFCTIESAFSIYHWYLCRQIQQPGPRPLYGRRFLRSVFAQALEAGLNPISAENSTQSYSTAVLSRFPSSKSSNGADIGSQAEIMSESSAPAEVRQRLGRLRAASFVPQFVQRPLSPDDPRAIKFQRDQARWFFGAPFEQITRRDVMHWLAWSLFATELEELEHEREVGTPSSLADGLVSTTPSAVNSPAPPSISTFANNHVEVREEEDVKGTRAKEGEWDPTAGDRLRFLEYCLELLEARQGKSYPLEPPKAPSDQNTILAAKKRKIRMMRLTIDPVRIASRPLAHYLVTNFLSWLTMQRAIRGGFTYHTEGRLTYLLRQPTPESDSNGGSQKDSNIPLIVLHGLGIGLAQYSSLVTFFLSSPIFQHRPVVILLQPNISQAIFSPSFLKPFGHHETTRAFRRILSSRSWSHIDILSHSYGSLVHSWLIKSLGPKVRRSCFVDPVCFQLWVPFVCSNFVYKRPTTPIEFLMRYFVARELGTANTLYRYFDWSSNILWPNEIENLQDPKKTRFFLAEEDAILSASDTRDYLIESGCPSSTIHYGHGKAHGQMLMHGGDDFQQIVEWLAMQI